MKETTLCYIEDDGKYLMMHRTKKEHDANQDKWIGVGGKLKEGETPKACLLREVKEETGLTLTEYHYRGQIIFQSDVWETEKMHLYTASGFLGDKDMSHHVCDEGELVWIPKEEVLKLPIWEGDKEIFRRLHAGIPYFCLELSYHGETLVLCREI